MDLHIELTDDVVARQEITKQMYDYAVRWLELAIGRAPIEMQTILQVWPGFILRPVLALTLYHFSSDTLKSLVIPCSSTLSKWARAWLCASQRRFLGWTGKKVSHGLNRSNTQEHS